MSANFSLIEFVLFAFLETRAFFAPCGPHRFHVPSGLKMRPVCVFLVHLCVTGSDWTQKYQPWGFECWLSCDAFQLVVAFVIANRAFLKKQGWSAHKPGAKRLQIRAKRAQIRANERTLKKGTTCIFRSALCSILIIMRAFGSRILMSPMFGDPSVVLTTSRLPGFDYTSEIIFPRAKRAAGAFVG